MATAPDISKSTVAVFNYFKVADGKTRADHIKAETDIWKHEPRMESLAIKEFNHDIHLHNTFTHCSSGKKPILVE